MKLVKYQGLSPECLEGFPKDCERSKQGALHLRPGRTMELTDDEYAFIKAQRPDVCRECVVLRSYKGKPKSADLLPASAKKSEEESAEKADSSDGLAEDEGDDGEAL